MGGICEPDSNNRKPGITDERPGGIISVSLSSREKVRFLDLDVEHAISGFQRMFFLEMKTRTCISGLFLRNKVSAETGRDLISKKNGLFGPGFS
jgi:hypothetical protein